MRHCLRVLSIALLSLLGACATGISPRFKFDPDKSTGLVVGSMSYESANAVFGLYVKNTAVGALATCSSVAAVVAQGNVVRDFGGYRDSDSFHALCSAGEVLLPILVK